MHQMFSQQQLSYQTICAGENYYLGSWYCIFWCPAKWNGATFVLYAEMHHSHVIFK